METEQTRAEGNAEGSLKLQPPALALRSQPSSPGSQRSVLDDLQQLQVFLSECNEHAQLVLGQKMQDFQALEREVRALRQDRLELQQRLNIAEDQQKQEPGDPQTANRPESPQQRSTFFNGGITNVEFKRRKPEVKAPPPRIETSQAPTSPWNSNLSNLGFTSIVAEKVTSPRALERPSARTSERPALSTKASFKSRTRTVSKLGKSSSALMDTMEASRQRRQVHAQGHSSPDEQDANMVPPAVILNLEVPGSVEEQNQIVISPMPDPRISASTVPDPRISMASMPDPRISTMSSAMMDSNPNRLSTQSAAASWRSSTMSAMSQGSSARGQGSSRNFLRLETLTEQAQKVSFVQQQGSQAERQDSVFSDEEPRSKGSPPPGDAGSDAGSDKSKKSMRSERSRISVHSRLSRISKVSARLFKKPTKAEIARDSQLEQEIPVEEPESSDDKQNATVPNEPTQAPPKLDQRSLRKSIAAFVFNAGDDETGDGEMRKVFCDVDAMKDKVREAIVRPEYSVVNLYNDSFFAHLACHPMFESLTLFVIMANACWIAVDVEHNNEIVLTKALPVFQVAEHIFCAYFTVEWSIRFMAFRDKKKGFGDFWFSFDAVMLVIMILETWILTLVFQLAGLSESVNTSGEVNTSVFKVIRLARIIRIARVAKVMRELPELMVLIKGMSVATRSVLFTFLLLFIIVYVFAVLFTQLCKQTSLATEDRFGSILSSMSFLLISSTAPDLVTIMPRIGAENMAFAVLYGLFIVLASLTVMNMLAGVLVEVVRAVSVVEREQMEVNNVKSHLHKLLGNTKWGRPSTHSLGKDGPETTTISRGEFEMLLSDKEAARALHHVGVDVIGLVDYVDFMFEEENTRLSFSKFMETIWQLRGSNTATVKDIVDLRRFMIKEMQDAHDTMLDETRFLINNNVCQDLQHLVSKLQA
eukprot:CAMPEP_0197620496 /NCGR_PEP_ID=MMETSP1338-20131121/1318_1 /TAXON_ID=43686 ORGANISM="Pelagodinium beii, Strain RCC1491" /NCGR_SAMPLE_ID=MMETSP1338 /ASSEMBLY_ACC=CAM_ASM_000754 /LENGTH=929 /DNA_ID=CAMNT_0043189705 /DNA_START=17 /DNA_END=2806 /DNA_ORIENTATION=-